MPCCLIYLVHLRLFTHKIHLFLPFSEPFGHDRASKGGFSSWPASHKGRKSAGYGYTVEMCMNKQFYTTAPIFLKCIFFFHSDCFICIWHAFNSYIDCSKEVLHWVVLLAKYGANLNFIYSSPKRLILNDSSNTQNYIGNIIFYNIE